MNTPFSKDQKGEIVSSLRRYFTENLEWDLSEMQARFLLEYLVSEIAPFAYNKGVDDCLLYTSPSPRDRTRSRMPSSA